MYRLACVWLGRLWLACVWLGRLWLAPRPQHVHDGGGDHANDH